MDDIMRAYNLPPHQRQEAAKAIDAKTNEIPKTHVLLRQFLPAFGHFIITDLKNITKLRTVQAALAVQRYSLKNNKLPDSLKTLVPDYLDVVPLDPFDGKELKYKKLDKGFVIYSIGEDKIGDGGKEQPKNKNQRDGSTYDITFIIER